MVDATRALLDELMGKERNKLPQERQNKDLQFSDPQVCKHFICGFCPSELFTNTKSDLGACTKLHDENCKLQFEQSKKKDQYPYMREFIRHLERLIDDLDRKIKKGRERLDHQDDKAEIPLSEENAQKVKEIDGKIQILLKQIEEFGEEGKIDESQQLMKDVDQLKAEKQAIILLSDNRPLSPQEKRMRVCDICGAFLVIGDTEKRIISHLEGKQHIGYALIRKTIEEYKRTHADDDRRDEERRFKQSGRDPRRGGPDRDRDYKRRDRDRDDYGRRDRDRDYDRERERDYDRDGRDKKRPREDH